MSLLEKVAADCEREVGLKFVLLTKPKAEDGSAQMRQLLASIRSEAEDGADPLVGSLPKDKHEGKVAELWGSCCADSGLAFVDASAGFAELLAPKDASEVLNIKKAAMLGAKVGKTCKGMHRTSPCMHAVGFFFCST